MSPVMRCLVSLIAAASLSFACGDDDDDRGDATPGPDAARDSALPPGDGSLPDVVALDAAASDAGPTPWVEILAPYEGANLVNPVTFEVAAGGGVTLVELLADDYPLSAAFDPAVQTTLEYTFSGVGYARTILLVGYVGQATPGTEVATDTVHITVTNGDIGTFHGSMWNTYYYFACESDYGGADDTWIYDDGCNPIAQVPEAFHDDVCIEGSGRLSDGRVINYASTCTSSCSAAQYCASYSYKVCYSVLDPVQFPWGMGSFGNALEPLRSWAVDNSVIPAGTLIYAQEWDGIQIPSIDGLGGFTHDGCFRADDVGGAIQNDHYDFFAGTHDMWQALEAIFPTHSTFDVYLDPGKCLYLEP